MIVRAAGILLGLLAVAAGAIAWHFRTGETRLTAIPPPPPALHAGKLPPPPAHVVVVVEENKNFSDIAGNLRYAPYLNELIARGALFTHAYGVAHPSQPNYTALFAGVADTNGDSCPPRGMRTGAPNLASELVAAHRTFAGYAEGLPAPGSHICWAGNYARKHVPWADFRSVTAAQSLPFSAFPPYAKLPTVAFVIPNVVHDMHSASIARGDHWLRAHMSALVDWAMTHDTLVILTWDESDQAVDNHIATIFVGPMVRPGRYATPVSHYRVLRTIEDLYKLPHAGASANVRPITSVWHAGR